jgi:uncharacterized membrane protein YkoI
MHKTIGMTAAVLIGAIVLGLGIYQSNASEGEPKLTEEDISQLVEQQYPGEITELEIGDKGDKAVYEVKVAGESKEYNMELDGNSGEVLEIREKEIAAKPNETDDEKETAETGQSDEKNDKATENSNKQSDDHHGILTVAQVREMALNEFPGVIKELELDKDDGHLKYEIEIKNENKEEAELDIDAYTGEILKMELEVKPHSQASKQLPKDILSVTEISEIALNEFTGTVKEIELDKDDGRLVYEVEIKNKGEEAELEIDARTGEVLEMEIDD